MRSGYWEIEYDPSNKSGTLLLYWMKLNVDPSKLYNYDLPVEIEFEGPIEPNK
jgi:hypothetical protein